MGPGYLELMGQTLVRGRSITEQDTAATQKIVVVDEAFVRKFFKPARIRSGRGSGLPM